MFGTKLEGESRWESHVDPFAIPNGITLDVEYFSDREQLGLFVPVNGVVEIGGMLIGGF